MLQSNDYISHILRGEVGSDFVFLVVCFYVGG